MWSHLYAQFQDLINVPRMSMVLMSSMIQALTGVKLYSQLFPIFANDTVDSTNDGCRKNVQGYVVNFGAIG